MPDETENDLRRINEELAIEENAGRRAFFDDRLAPGFVLRRANGEINSREFFLASLKPGGERVCDPKSIVITPIGRNRALVTCVITIQAQANHNARLFVKSAEGRWQLLAWANEYMP
jgi:hypothetical protein